MKVKNGALKHFKKIPIFLLLMTFICLLQGCSPPTGATFEKIATIKNGQWSSDDQPSFTIDIKDTTSSYQSFILLRNDDSYLYANIWLNFYVKGPGDTAFSNLQRYNLKLADIAGAWLGKGMGSIWEHKIPIREKDALHFTKAGTYQIKIEQMMRKDPLPGVLNIGLIIKKGNRKKNF